MFKDQLQNERMGDYSLSRLVCLFRVIGCFGLNLLFVISRRVLEGGEMSKDHVRKMIIRDSGMERNVVMMNVSSSIIDQDPRMEMVVCVPVCVFNT